MGLKEGIVRLADMLLPYRMFRTITTAYDHIILKDKTQKYLLPYFYKKKLGAKKKYYIFRFPMPSYMLFAAGIQYIFAYEWAYSKGFVPVIDMETEYDFRRGRLGAANLWDSCFRQEASVEEALKQEYVFVENVGGASGGAS